MKFGIRECANITFRAKKSENIGNKIFSIGQPILYIDSANIATINEQTTTSYASGGRNGGKLIAWEGDKSITLNITDALLSSVSLSLLDGTQLIKKRSDKIYVHSVCYSTINIEKQNNILIGVIDITNDLLKFGPVQGANAVKAETNQKLYIIRLLEDESDLSNLFTFQTATYSDGKITLNNISINNNITNQLLFNQGESFKSNVLVDYYVIKKSNKVSEIQISPYTLSNYYYVEADTLFRSQISGLDVPVNITFPNVKLQSNFTITLSGSGDPSTFDFVVEAFPGYTYFDRNRKVLFVIQTVDDSNIKDTSQNSVMLSNNERESEEYLTPFENRKVTILDLLNLKHYADNLYPEISIGEPQRINNALVLNLNTIMNEDIHLQEENQGNNRLATKEDFLKLEEYVYNKIQSNQNTMELNKQSDIDFFNEDNNTQPVEYATVKDLMILKKKINLFNPNFSEIYLNLKEG